MAVQMTAIDQCFPVVFFFYAVHCGSDFWVRGWNPQVKATEQYFPVVLFILLYKVALTFESVAIQMKALSSTFLCC